MRHAVLFALLLSACSDDAKPPPSAKASFDAQNITLTEASFVDVCANNPGWSCERPTEFSIRLLAVYVSEDIDPMTGANVGLTQAIFGSQQCDLADETPGVLAQPNLATCSLDLGYTSSAGEVINGQPDFLDLAQPTDTVRATLAGQHFAITPGTYRYIRLDFGSNAVDAPGDGTQDTLPPNTATNVRFKAPGLDAPYSIRVRSGGVTVKFEDAVTVRDGDTLDVELDYDLSKVIKIVPESDLAHVDANRCTAAIAGYLYCVDFESLELHPVVKVNGVVAGDDCAACTKGDGKWVRTPRGTGTQTVTNVATDAAGNAIVAGWFDTGVDIGTGTIAAAGDPHATFIAKLRPDGGFVWMRTFATPDGATYLNDVATDASGNVYASLYQSGTMNYGLGDTLAASHDDVFVLLDKESGATQRVDRVTNASSNGAHLAIDSLGNVVFGASFSGTVTIGATNLTASGTSDIYVAVMDGTGTITNAVKLGGSAAEYLDRLAITKQSDVVLVGRTAGATPIGGGAVTAAGPFFARYSSSLTSISARPLPPTAIVEGVAADVLGDVLIVGEYSGRPDFGGGLFQDGGPWGDKFMVKYDATNTHVTSRRFGTYTFNELWIAGTLDASGYIYVAGHIAGTAVNLFGTGAVSTAGADAYVAKYDPTGLAMWSRVYGDTNEQFATAITVAAQSIIVGGVIQGSVTFGPNVAATGSYDGFIVGLEP